MALTDSNDEKSYFLHLTYHPQDPSYTIIKQIFYNMMLKPIVNQLYHNFAAFRASPLKQIIWLSPITASKTFSSLKP
jgi:hypothetical protein